MFILSAWSRNNDCLRHALVFIISKSGTSAFSVFGLSHVVEMKEMWANQPSNTQPRTLFF